MRTVDEEDTEGGGRGPRRLRFCFYRRYARRSGQFETESQPERPSAHRVSCVSQSVSLKCSDAREEPIKKSKPPLKQVYVCAQRIRFEESKKKTICFSFPFIFCQVENK